MDIAPRIARVAGLDVGGGLSLNDHTVDRPRGDDHDSSTPVVRALMERGDDNALAALRKALESGASNPAIYIVALYKLGDASRADETKKIAMSDDHAANLRTEAARLIATKAKDMSVIAALDSLAHGRRTKPATASRSPTPSARSTARKQRF